jgi:hypothetical protein
VDIWGGIGRGMRGFFRGMVRGVSNPRKGSKILTFLYRPRLVGSSWNVNSTMTFAMTGFSEVRSLLAANSDPHNVFRNPWETVVL